MSTTKKIPWGLIAGIVITVLAIFLVIGSYLKGKNDAEEKYRQQVAAVDVRMDSLRNVEFRLRGSLDSLRKHKNEIIIIRTVYKTVYDTVRLKTVPVSIVDGLNSVIETPIPPNE